MSRNKTIIKVENKVSCLPGYENFDTKSIAQRLPKFFHLKSSRELQMEKDKHDMRYSTIQHYA
jgi:hypothetical protein